jgi:hypothetical protein
MTSIAVSPKKVSQQFIQLRAATLEEMSPAERTRLAETEAFMNQQQGQTLRFFYQLGQRFIEDEATFGAEGLERQIRAMMYAEDTIRKTKIFAEQWNAEDLERVIQMRNPDYPGKMLHWAHMRYLLSVDSRDKRMELAEKAVEQCMNPRSVNDAVKKLYGGRRGSGGRTFGRPATLKGKVRQMVQVTREWIGRDTQVWSPKEDGTITELMQLSPDSVDDELLEEVDEAYEMMTQIIARATVEQEALEKARKRLQGIHAAAGNGEAAPAKRGAKKKATRAGRPAGDKRAAQKGKRKRTAAAK